MISLKNKVAVITGAAGGLGKALATECYAQGCHLALIDIDLPGLEITKNGLEINSQIISIHYADVSIEQTIVSAKTEILTIHKRIDMLINNAGISISQNFEQMDVTDYKQLFDVNFWGTVYCTKHFLSELKKQNDSRLVNIISDFAFMGFPGKTAYGSSKSAVLGFTNAMKTELAETSVKICFVVPPPLATNIVKSGKHIDDKKKENEILFLQRNGLPVDRTAKKIIKLIKKGKYRIIIGTMMFWMDILARLFPTFLHRLIGKNKKRFDFV
jgi:short-subunit dehydrogenase